MNGFKTFITENLIVIISTLIAIGGFIALIKFQGDAIKANTTQQEANKERIVLLEKNMIKVDAMNDKILTYGNMITADKERIINVEKAFVRVEAMQNDISEIKTDIREIKKVLQTPAYIANLKYLKAN